MKRGYITLFFVLLFFQFSFLFASPEINFVFLNSSNIDLNDTNQNLSLFVDYSGSNESIKSFFSWHKNNVPLYGFLYGFEIDSNSSLLVDYSGNENFGEILGPTFSPNLSYDNSGNHFFDGINDYVKINSSDSLNFSGNLTIGCWVNFSRINFNSGQIIVMRDNGGSSYNFEFGTYNNKPYFGYDDSKYFNPSSFLTTYGSKWIHYAVVVTNSVDIRFYLNGDLFSNGTISSGSLSTKGGDIYIGSERGDDYFFNGSLDDLIISKKAFTPMQIKLLYENKTNFLHSSFTSLGEVWSGRTVLADYSGVSSSVFSNNLTISDLPSLNVFFPENKNYSSLNVNVQLMVSSNNPLSDIGYSINDGENISLDKVEVGNSWYHFGGNLNREGYTESYIPSFGEINLLWRSGIVGKFDEFQTLSIVNGVGYWNSKDAALLKAINLSDGKNIWNYTFEIGVKDSNYRTSATSDGTPTYDEESNLLYVSVWGNATQPGYLYALNTSNELMSLSSRTIWRVNTSVNQRDMISSPGINYDEGLVYIYETYAEHPNMSILYGINKTNGEKVWSYNYTLTNGYAYNSPTYFDGKVFGCFYSSSSSLLVPKVFAWNSSTGEVIWNATGGNRGCWDSSPVIHGNSVYFGSWDGSVFKLNSSTGEVIFERDFGSGVIYSNLAIKGDRIYGASSGDRFFCVNSSNGSTCLGWTDFVHGSAQWASPALGDDLVVASTRNSPSLLFALNSSTGEMVWNYTYGVNSYSSPTIANGIIYIANDDGYIYAIGNKSYYKYNSTIIGSPGENQVTFYVNDSLGSYRSKVINFYLDVEEIENSTEEDEQNDSVENNSSNSGTSTSYSYRPLSYDYTSQDISNLKEINKVLRLREKINFVFSNENHSILFSRANRTNAIIKVFSSSFERNFSIGETHFFDLNSDNLNDLFITLNELDNYRANITFGYVLSKQEILEEFVDKEVVVQENVTNSFGGYFYLLVAFFFLIILFFSIRFFKKYRSKNNSKY